MVRTRRPAAAPARRTAAPVALPSAGLPAAHPAIWGTALVVAACIVASTAYLMFEPDLWQHLLTGRVIWTHGVQTRQVWVWPIWGGPDANSSWGFEALLWPVWRLGGTVGLTAWRAVTALLAFGLLWATARRMGARGVGALFAIALCALATRPRMNVRPESLAGILLALELWILESRRRGGRDRAAWLPLVSWAWANVHISFPLGWLVAAFYLLDERFAARRGRAGSRAPVRSLALALLAGIALSFANPYGWRAVAQPFEFFLAQRGHPLYRTVGELMPLDLGATWGQGLPFVLLGWPLLLLWRWRRAGLDLAELALCLTVTALALSSRRFTGPYAFASAPFLARDLDAWLGSRRWPRPAPALAAVLTAAACVGAGLYEWTRPFPRPGFGIDRASVPEAACDFIASRGVRGRFFNQFHLGGYLLWRFWPERDRLPFMDIHLAGAPGEQALYAYARGDERAWRELEARHRFDVALLMRRPPAGDAFVDRVEGDSTWALVFADDVAALYVRRDGASARVAATEAYPRFRLGRLATPLGAACLRDTAVRREVEQELERQIRSSPRHSLALTLLGSLLLLDGRIDEGRARLGAALALDPLNRDAWERLGAVDVARGEGAAALRAFGRARALGGGGSALEYRTGQAWQRLGNLPRARAAYRRAFLLDASNQPAMDSLDALQRRR